MKIRRSSVAVATATLALLAMLTTAEPASAATTCTQGMFPRSPVGYSSLAVGCLIDISTTPSLNPSGIEVHDALNAAWHRGAARTVGVTTTTGSTTIGFTAGAIVAGDARRPISGTGIAGGAFIVSVGVNTAVLSQKSTATGVITATIEHTAARVITDAKFPVGGATTTVTSATAAFTASDVNLSVSGSGFAAGARISSVVNPTTAVVTPGITDRAGQVLTGNGAHTTGTKTVTGWTGPALLDPSDVGAAVTGIGIAPGSTISAVLSGTSFTLSANATSTATTALTITGATKTLTLGATKFTAAYPSLAQSSLESSARQLTKTTAVTCVGSVLTTTAAGLGFVATDVNLPVTFLNNGATVAGTWKVSGQTATTATLSAACPATWTQLAIGKPGVNAPLNADVMAHLRASMNVNPAIVSSVDNCKKNTYEGFEYSGRWQNPGSYVPTPLTGSPPPASVAQIAFDTGLVSFAAYVVPVPVSDTTQAGPHYDVVFTNLPTSSFSVTCPLGGAVTTNRTALSLDFAGTVALPRTGAPAAGAGNPSTASVRAIGATTGLFGAKVVLKNGATTLGTFTPTPCTISAATVAPDFSCGTG